jgi:hypothetical protein
VDTGGGKRKNNLKERHRMRKKEQVEQVDAEVERELNEGNEDDGRRR